MKIFVASASGAIGLPLIEKLLQAGHEVAGMTQSASGSERLHKAGAVPAIADALSAEQVNAAVRRYDPEIIIDQLTSITKRSKRYVERGFS